MFRTKTYEVTENWLEPLVIPHCGSNREYLTKARVHDMIFQRLYEHRGHSYKFETRIFHDKVVYVVSVEDDGIHVFEGKKMVYESKGTKPDRLEEFADWMAWKMVNDR